MDSIVSAALTEICSQGINGILLKDLWPALQKTPFKSLCDGEKTTIYDRLVKMPGLQFQDFSEKSSSSLSSCSYEEAEKLGLKIVAAEHLRDSFVGLYDLKSADAGISAPQRRTLEKLARARSAGVTQSQLATELDMKGNNIFYVVRNLECQGLVVRQSTTVRTKASVMEGESVSNNPPIVHTNLIHLYRYAMHLNPQQKFKITKGVSLESPKHAQGSTSNGDTSVEDHIKEDVLVEDHLPALKAVCDKLEQADGKVLVVSDIKQALGYREAPGHRAWRNICKRLKDAGLVEEFAAEVNGKNVRCMQLLKKFNHKQFETKHAVCGADDFNSNQPVKCGNRRQVSAHIFELSIEHQVHDTIAAEGTKGITVDEILKRRGLNNKKYYTRLLNMFSRFGCHLQAENHNKSKLYRVWTSGNFTDSSLSTLPSKPTDVADVVEPSSQSKKDLDLHDKSDEDMLQLDSLTINEESAPEKVESEQKGREPFCSPGAKTENKRMVISGSSGNAEFDLVQDKSNDVPSETPPSSNHSRVRSNQIYPCLTLTAASSQREQRLLERIQEEKFILFIELYKWLESLEKETPTTLARKTVTRALNKLQNEGHCKCFQVAFPVLTNYGRSRTVEVVLHNSVQRTPVLWGLVYERLRSFDMLNRGQGLARTKNENSVPVLTGLNRIISNDTSNSQSVSAEAMRSRKRKRISKTKSSKHGKSANRESGVLKTPLSESNCEYAEEEDRITTDLEDHDIHYFQEREEELQAENGELGTNGEGDQCAFPITSRHSKFTWTETSDRQLVVQYARYRVKLGVKIYRTSWATIPDLPAPAEACKRRMASLKKNQDFRGELMSLCDMLGFRYVHHLQKSKEKKLQFNDGSGNTFPDFSIKKCAASDFSSCLERNLGSEFEGQMWDNFEDQRVSRALDKVLRCLRVAKTEFGKQVGTSPERHLGPQQRDFQEVNCDQPTTTNGEEMQIYGGKQQKRTKCHHLPGKFLKLFKEGTGVSRRPYESLAVANAVELLKLAFLCKSTAPEVPTLLADTLSRYSEQDRFAAFNYLVQKKFMVGGNGSRPFGLSQQFMRRVSSSPFPVNTGKRASKFASWLREREKSLMEEGIHLNADLQCGEIFHLLALVCSGELCISPCLPEEGVGDAEEKRNSKRKSCEDEICNSDQDKKPADGECCTRREKGFPGINVSLFRAVIPRINRGEVSNNDIRTCSSRVDRNVQSICTAMGTGGDGSFVSAKLNSRNDVGSSVASPWNAMADYGEYLMSNLSDEDRVGPLYPEIFQNLHSAILESGDQGLGLVEISQVAAVNGEKMAELVVDVLQVFGLSMRVNGYNDVHVVDASFYPKYFLSSSDGRCQNTKYSPRRKRARISDNSYSTTSQEHWEKDATNMESDVVHKVTMPNITKDVAELPVESQPHEVNVTFQDTTEVVLVSLKRQRENSGCTITSSDYHSFRPILPWINGDGTTNNIVYKALTRRVLGIVMQNPGILENDLIQQMNTLNPQNCRKLLGLMVLDNHLIVKKMYQTTSAGPPGTLLRLFGKSFKKSESICREHFFANPMSTSCL